MALQPAVCSNCGGTINVDSDKEKMYCQYCGTCFFVKDIINNTYEINIDSKNIKIINSAKFRMDNGKEYNEAFEALITIENQEQDNKDFWWQMLRATTCDFDIFPTPNDAEHIIRFIKKYENLEKESEDNFKIIYAYLVQWDRYAQALWEIKLNTYTNWDNIWPALNDYEELCKKNGAEDTLDYVRTINQKFYEHDTMLGKSLKDVKNKCLEVSKQVYYLTDRYRRKYDYEEWEKEVKKRIDSLSDSSKKKISEGKISGGGLSFNAQFELVDLNCVCSEETLEEVINKYF